MKKFVLVSLFAAMLFAQAEAKTSGKGETQDLAVRQLTEAAKQGDPDAQFKLAEMLSTGQGTRRNDAEAVRWYRAAAKQGHGAAANSLGLLYANGVGVGQDASSALRCFRAAQMEGNADAEANFNRVAEAAPLQAAMLAPRAVSDPDRDKNFLRLGNPIVPARPPLCD